MAVTNRRGDLWVEIVTSTAEAVGASPLEIEPLGSVVDPALLDEFVTNDAVAPDTKLRFEYEGTEVVVAGDGRVSIAEPTPEIER